MFFADTAQPVPTLLLTTYYLLLATLHLALPSFGPLALGPRPFFSCFSPPERCTISISFHLEKAVKLCILTKRTFPHIPHKMVFCGIFFTFAQHLVDFWRKFSTFYCEFFSHAEKIPASYTKFFFKKTGKKTPEKRRFNSFLASIW